MKSIKVPNKSGGFDTWTQDKVKETILTNDEACKNALLRIYENQTADEQAVAYTKHVNGIGFTGFDAELLSSFAEQVKNKKSLSSKQLEICRKRMAKYAGQIYKWMESKYAQYQNVQLTIAA